MLVNTYFNNVDFRRCANCSGECVIIVPVSTDAGCVRLIYRRIQLHPTLHDSCSTELL